MHPAEKPAKISQLVGVNIMCFINREGMRVVGGERVLVYYRLQAEYMASWRNLNAKQLFLRDALFFN